MQQVEIPILGIDERPLERQNTPGLCKEIINLRPDGKKDDPHWRPIQKPNLFTNTAGDPFIVNSNTKAMHWHVRSRISEFGDANGSLERLVTIRDSFGNGVVEVYDPNISAGWSVVVSRTVISSLPGEWNMHLQQMYNIGYITITKGGTPVKDFILQDDLLNDATFPELPVIKAFGIENDEPTTHEQLQAGSHIGLRAVSETGAEQNFIAGQSYIFYRYAYRLADGTLVKHSPVFTYRALSRSNPDAPETDWFQQKVGFFYEGYLDAGSTPSNFDFWKKQITGVTVLVTSAYQYTTSGADLSTFFNLNALSRHLENSTFHEVGTFDFIDPSEISLTERIIEMEGNEEDIISFPVADIDDNTHHAKAHGPGITYNSRLILGQEHTDFVRPSVGSHEAGRTDVVYFKKFDLIFINHADMPGSITVELGNLTNATGIVTPYTGFTVIEMDYFGGTYAFEIRVTHEFADSYRITLDQDKVASYTGVCVPIEEYQPWNEFDFTRNLKFEVELQTALGNFKRVTIDGDPTAIWTNASFGWVPRSRLIGYPDRRAKKIRIFVDVSGNYQLLREVPLISAERFNYAFSIKPFFGVNYANGIDTNGSDPSVNPDETVNENNLLQPDKVKASNVNTVFAFESDQVYSAGLGNEPVTAFAVNTLEMGQGQFGQFPLFIFKESAIYAFDQSGDPDVLFARVTPVDTSVGCSSVNLVANAGRLIIFKSKKGIYSLSGSSIDRISDPVESHLPNIKSVGYRRRFDDQEILFALPDKTLVFSLEYGRWYMESTIIEKYITKVEDLYGLNGADFYDFSSLSTDPVTLSLKLGSIHFTQPNELKRFIWFYVRGDLFNDLGKVLPVFRLRFEQGKEFTLLGYKVYPRWRSETSVEIELTATITDFIKSYLHTVAAEVDVRYPRRIQSPQ